MEFCTIASGSSGNCTYIGTDYTKILIDAGISGKKIEEGLANLKLTGDKIDALFITHEHVDHIKGAGILSRRFDDPHFCHGGYLGGDGGRPWADCAEQQADCVCG